MPELRVDHASLLPNGTPSVSPDQRRRQGARQQQHGGGQSRPGAEELAVALDGRQQLSARFEQDADGQPLVRVFDRERGETVALLTPEELRALAEQTGLPPGMLIHVSS
ncbi:MAG: hypothetical protein WC273_06635 [Dehalococcoidia bacterium]